MGGQQAAILRAIWRALAGETIKPTMIPCDPTIGSSMAFITRLRLVALFSAGIATLALGLWLKLAPEQALVSGPCLCRGHSCGKATASRCVRIPAVCIAEVCHRI